MLGYFEDIFIVEVSNLADKHKEIYWIEGEYQRAQDRKNQVG